MSLPLPTPEQFGLSQEEIDEYAKNREKKSQGVFWFSFAVTAVLIGLACGELFLLGLLCGAIPGVLVGGIVGMIHEKSEAQQPLALKIAEYQRACLEAKRQSEAEEADVLRRKRAFWTSLSGKEFERELASLYRKRGYEARLTPSTGDAGVDIWLQKDGKRIAVQCKRWDEPAGVGVARDLFGTLHAQKADRAILACTGGFTQGVYDFVQEKPVDLLDLDGILKMQEGHCSDFRSGP